MRLNFASLLLPAYAAAASINDNPPTSVLINQDNPLVFQAVQVLREQRGLLHIKRHLEALTSSHESRKLKPDSTKSSKTKSSKNDSKSSKAQYGSCDTIEAELEDIKAKLADTEAKLAALQEEMTQAQWLFVQAADKCVLDMSGDTPTIESANFHGDTELFTDRPLTYANTTSTSSWFTKFNELFNDGDGWPNSAMTFVNDDESVGVVVTAFVNGYIKDGEGNQKIYGYDLNQSEEQKKVKSLEEIMGGQDKVEFDHCSFFIDEGLTIPNPKWVFD
jgi:hypothetical protein